MYRNIRMYVVKVPDHFKSVGLGAADVHMLQQKLPDFVVQSTAPNPWILSLGAVRRIRDETTKCATKRPDVWTSERLDHRTPGRPYGRLHVRTSGRPDVRTPGLLDVRMPGRLAIC